MTSEPETIFTSIIRQSNEKGDQAAIINDDGESKTFAQLSKSVASVAWGLQRESLVPETRCYFGKEKLWLCFCTFRLLSCWYDCRTAVCIASTTGNGLLY